MQNKDVRVLLALHRAPQLSRKALCRLLSAVESVDDIFHLSANTLVELGVPALQQTTLFNQSCDAVSEDIQTLGEQAISL